MTTKNFCEKTKKVTGIKLDLFPFIPYRLKLLVAILDTYSQVMVVPKIQHIHQSMTMIASDCSKHGQLRFNGKCYLEMLPEIDFFN